MEHPTSILLRIGLPIQRQQTIMLKDFWEPYDAQPDCVIITLLQSLNVVRIYVFTLLVVKF